MSSAADRRRAAAAMVPRPEELRAARLGGSPGELEIRSDTCRILDKTILLIKDKLMEMYHICAQVDKLETYTAPGETFRQEIEATKVHLLKWLHTVFPS